MTQLSRNAQLLKYFAQQYPGIPRTRLVKLVYMSDVLARQYLGHPISTFRYVHHYFGPYDGAVESAAEELEAAGLARQEFDRGPELTYKRLHDNGTPTPFSFTLGENEVLAYVSANYVQMPMREFLDDVVYETLPMKLSERRQAPLEMSVLDHTGSKAVGFDLERVLRAEQQAESGNYKTLRTFGDELRAAIAARRTT